MRAFRFLFRNARSRILLVASMSIVGSVASWSLIALVSRGIAQHGFGAAGFAQFVALALVSQLVYGVSSVVVNRVGESLARELRTELVTQVLASPMQQLQDVGREALSNALVQHVERVAGATPSVPTLAHNSAIVLIGLVYLLITSPVLWASTIVVGIVGAAVFQSLLARARLWGGRSADARVDLLRHLDTVIDGAKELKLDRTRRERLMRDEFTPTARTVEHADVRQNVYGQLANGWGQLLAMLTIGCLVFAAGLVGHVATATLMNFVLAAFFLIGPLGMVMDSMLPLMTASIALERLDTLRAVLQPEPTGDAQPMPVDAAWRRLRLRGVTVRYRNAGDEPSFVLGPLDLTLEAGRIVFVIGGNGSGKSTLARVLVGLYAPASGTIRLDDTLVDDGNRAWYRAHFAAVFADYHLFDSVAVAWTPAMAARADALLTRYGLHEKVTLRDGRFSTVRLSSGQRRRLALLTAELEDRPIYLFDEWASDQDPHYKRMFYFEVLPELRRRGRTVVVVTHDDRYFHLADAVVKLEDGRVVDEVIEGAAPRVAG